MSDSLREQLLKAGLATEKQYRQASRQTGRQQQPSKGEKRKATADAALAKKHAAARAAKAERDRELSRQREADAQAKARWAEIRQMIEQHRVPKPDGYDYFNFVDRGKVRRVPVNAQIRERITSKELCIVRCEGRYDLVPAAVAERIRERIERAVVNLDSPAGPTDPDDPYKDYVIPDDLIW